MVVIFLLLNRKTENTPSSTSKHKQWTLLIYGKSPVTWHSVSFHWELKSCVWKWHARHLESANSDPFGKEITFLEEPVYDFTLFRITSIVLGWVDHQKRLIYFVSRLFQALGITERKDGTVIKIKASGSKLPGFVSQHYHLQPVWPWASHITFLYLSFLVL